MTKWTLEIQNRHLLSEMKFVLSLTHLQALPFQWEDDYELRYPIRRGMLNYTSLTNLEGTLNDLETIFLHAMKILGIPRKDIKVGSYFY